MSYVFLGVPLLMYLAQAIFVYAQQGRYGMALCFLGYGIANAGLIWDSMR